MKPPPMTAARAFLLAARPKTLPAAVAPVITGCALAWRLTGHFSLLLAMCTLFSTICIQIATNYFNDAVDAAKGADTPARLGPLRATSAGLVSRRSMFIAGGIVGIIAIAWSLPMVSARGWPIVAIGMISLFFSYGYTGGPFPLAYRGLGEIFVFLFFGLIAVSGTVFVQTGLWMPASLLAGGQIGALSTVLIAINNLRDIEEDTVSGKRTTAVRYGERSAKFMIAVWCLLPYVLGCGWLALRKPTLAWLPAVGLILGAQVAGMVYAERPSSAYNRFLARGALHLLLWTAFFVIACLKDTGVLWHS